MIPRHLDLGAFFCVAFVLCGCGAKQQGQNQTCSFGIEPSVLLEAGAARLVRWEVPERAVLVSEKLPNDIDYSSFRKAARVAGAAVKRPTVFPLELGEEAEKNWPRELRNQEIAYEGKAGNVRPIQCLEALLFSYQNRRFSQIEKPTEFIASVLRKEIDGEVFLRIYMGGSDSLFPPKDFYTLDQVDKDLESGWDFQVMLHNHTVQKKGKEIALGVPAPSTTDVQFLQMLLAERGLKNGRVTNGFYTVDIPSPAFAEYLGPR